MMISNNSDTSMGNIIILTGRHTHTHTYTHTPPIQINPPPNRRHPVQSAKLQNHRGHALMMARSFIRPSMSRCSTVV